MNYNYIKTKHWKKFGPFLSQSKQKYINYFTYGYPKSTYAHRMSIKLSSICYACSCISLVKGNLIHFKYMFDFVFSMDYMYKYMYINVVSPEPPISDYA